MATLTLTGSPTSRRQHGGRAHSQENQGSEDVSASRSEVSNMLKRSATALTSSKLANQAPKNLKINHDAKRSPSPNHVDKLLATLSEQQAVLKKQHEVLTSASSYDENRYSIPVDYIAGSCNSSLPITPATDTFASTGPSTSPPSVDDDSPRQANDEVLRLKLELEQAKGRIAQMNHELVQTRFARHTFEGSTIPSSESDFSLATPSDGTNSRMSLLQQPFQPTARSLLPREKSMPISDDARSDISDPISTPGFNRVRAIWNNGTRAAANMPLNTDAQPIPGPYSAGPWVGRSYGQLYNDMSLAYAGNSGNMYRAERGADADLTLAQASGRRSGQSNRAGGRNGSFSYSNATPGFDTLNGMSGSYASISALPGATAGMAPMYSGAVYQPQPIGSRLTAQAPEFNPVSTWKAEVQAIPGESQTYLPPTEPLNYRRLLDRSVNCNWKYIVDKIVCNNDQQASIFLQQKLKVGTAEQKYEIVEAIVAQAYALMINRFGNFLVQRCFEHGTPEQVIKIAEAIRGNTLNLSMDAFGCHVIQKAFDSVPEDYKAMMVHELLRRIPETVIHRYACHVWQKLFELRWTESPPQIMRHVNEALRGMWHEVALGETGSLVVQNIFENCLEEDKRPCIEEVLASIDIVAHGQFGNWCIQHICEHGAPADRSRAIDHVIRYATEYSMDQFASKVVEKCLKIGGTEFLSRYLDRVCEGRLDRPRIPLIDIASDQYGNYLIQYILTHSNPQHREVVAGHIRKHMVSLRGSKFGSRVGMLCTNPAVATRPGPGAGVNVTSIGNRMPQNSRYGGYR